MAITTKRLVFGETYAEAVMPRKGGLYFRDMDGRTWTPDTADLHILWTWFGRELELRTARAKELVRTDVPSPVAALRKPKGSKVASFSVQASQGAASAEEVHSVDWCEPQDEAEVVRADAAKDLHAEQVHDSLLYLAEKNARKKASRDASAEEGSHAPWDDSPVVGA